MEVEIVTPSMPQMKKLHTGKPFRATLGAGLKLHVPTSVGKKLMKASMKGMGATVDSCHCMGCGMCGGNVTHTAKDSGSRLLVAGTDRAVQALEGSGYGGNVTHTAKDSGSRLLVAGTDRAVQALEGSGRGKYFTYDEGTGEYKQTYPNRHARTRADLAHGGNVKNTGRKNASRLINAATDRAVRALEGSGGYRDRGNEVYPIRYDLIAKDIVSQHGGQIGTNQQLAQRQQALETRQQGLAALDHKTGRGVNPFAKQKEKKLDKEKDDLMKQMNQQMKKQSDIMKMAKKAKKTESPTVNKDLMNKVTQQAKVSKKLMDKAADLREEADDNLQGQMRQYTRHMPMEGGKVNRRKKFDQWFKSIGSKFKTLNHNLGPIKQAATKRAVQVIKYTKNPVAQGKALLDMAKDEMGNDDASGSATNQMINQGLSPEMLSKAVSSNSFSQIQAEGQPVDVNDDGEADGYFYPREMSYFGAGMKRMNRCKGGMAEMGRPTTMPIKRPVPVYSGMGAKKSSPWIDHVKAYASKHGVKYGQALKLARPTYKKGMSAGALYPAGMDPRYD